jgi:hypothetical protein
MPKVFPCYSIADRKLARELATFLERGAGVEVLLEEGEMAPGEDLIAKVEQGLSADAVLVMLSPDAVPARWILERWKSVFWEQAADVGTALATLLCRDAKFPDLLRRKNFFDLRENPLAAFRSAKRWLMGLWAPPQASPFSAARQPWFVGRDAELEALGRTVADVPGIVVLRGAAGVGKTALALNFVRRFRDDFDAAFWLTCGARSVPALAGDLAAQLGASLERDLQTNLHEIRRLLGQHRCLLVLDDAGPAAAAALVPRGRTSALVTTRYEESPRHSLRQRFRWKDFGYSRRIGCGNPSIDWISRAAVSCRQPVLVRPRAFPWRLPFGRPMSRREKPARLSLISYRRKS